MPKKPQRLAGEWEFVLPAEQQFPETERGVFVLAPLTHADRIRVRDTISRVEFSPDGSVQTQSHAFRQAHELVLDYLVKTVNVPSDAPEAWPGLSAPREAREQWIERNLDDVNVLVIGTAIREASFVGEPLKNS